MLQPTHSQKGPRGVRQAPGRAGGNPRTHATVPPARTAQGRNLLHSQLWGRSLETQGGSSSSPRASPQPSERSGVSGSLRTPIQESSVAGWPRRAPATFQLKPPLPLGPPVSLDVAQPGLGCPLPSPFPTPPVTTSQRPLGVGASQNPHQLTPKYSIHGFLQNYSDPPSLTEPQPTLSTFVWSRMTSWLPLQTEDLASARLGTRVSQGWDGLARPAVG